MRRLLFAVLVTVIGLFVIACSSGGQQRQATPSATPLSSAVVSTPTPVSAQTATSSLTAAPTQPPPTSAPVTPAPAPSISFVDNSDCRGISRELLRTVDVVIEDSERSVSIVAEHAESEAEKSQGLMCREAVPESTGMLFTWNEPRTGGFWMYNTYAPLDILYIGESSIGVAFRQMQPCFRFDHEQDSEWTQRCGGEAASYRPFVSYIDALELPQGFLESHGFNTEDPRSISVSFILES